MKVPNANEALIQPAKLSNYLLSRSHPVGGSKARFFEMLGYTPVEWRRLETDLREQHLTQDAFAGRPTRYGQKFEVWGTLTGPSGRSAALVSVWVVRKNEEFPRFVTAFPGDPT